MIWQQSTQQLFFPTSIIKELRSGRYGNSTWSFNASQVARQESEAAWCLVPGTGRSGRGRWGQGSEGQECGSPHATSGESLLVVQRGWSTPDPDPSRVWTSCRPQMCALALGTTHLTYSQTHRQKPKHSRVNLLWAKSPGWLLHTQTRGLFSETIRKWKPSSYTRASFLEVPWD